MHIKSAVILCALYFVTVTQSIGLSKGQLEHIVKLFCEYKKSNNLIPMEGVTALMEKMRVENNSDFKLNEDKTNDQNAQDFMVFLATNEKGTDSWTDQSVTSFEVLILVSLFDKRDRMGTPDGLLNYEEVMEVVDALILTSEIRKFLGGEFHEGYEYNAVEVVDGYLTEKTDGKGLDYNQIKQLNIIKDFKKDGVHIDDVEITTFYKKLSLVKDEYKSLLDLKTTRTAPLALQELMVNSSEYYYIQDEVYSEEDTSEIDNELGGIADHHCHNKDCHTLEQHRLTAEHNQGADKTADLIYTTSSVREFIQEFTLLDADKNGALGDHELIDLVKRLSLNQDIDAITKRFDTDASRQLDVVEFFMVAVEINLIIIDPDTFDYSKYHEENNAKINNYVNYKKYIAELQ
ncbi:uncharacterized protein LOC126845947 isoform X16 [Adelges cooleyi]|uniref:uncharacterized protein LOC126845947 isoform X14 n=1 Tax=Adelges cooleyi TaxID=133065 RepID=UPI00217F6A3E|nr:uncharacterized protein LOC126845947 isoform X14 [Adelges cooleyi]XP_050440982.1 uncharacterized protein LOC126845947 isoform X15 [Adelges cooleyi]XP_050440983.1 uncharacterized protein LOC126845947 isoform X16 [Adelges cooleyi]